MILKIITFLLFLLPVNLIAGYSALKDSFLIKIAHEQKIIDAI